MKKHVYFSNNIKQMASSPTVMKNKIGLTHFWLWTMSPSWTELPGVLRFYVICMNNFNIPDVFPIVSCVKYSCYMCSWTYLTCSWLWVVWSTPAICVHEHTWCVPDCELCEVLLFHVFMNIPDVFLIVSCVKYSCFICSKAMSIWLFIFSKFTISFSSSGDKFTAGFPSFLPEI